MCRSRSFWRLFGVYAALLIASFSVLGWFLIQRIENHLLQEIQHSLEIKTLLLRDLVKRHGESELQEQITRVATETNSRITLIRDNGAVLADSAERPSKMENHADR